MSKNFAQRTAVYDVRFGLIQFVSTIYIGKEQVLFYKNRANAAKPKHGDAAPAMRSVHGWLADVFAHARRTIIHKSKFIESIKYFVMLNFIFCNLANNK
jgi:hypothetical protein